LEPPRIYLTGRLAIEQGTTLVSERELPGRQGRRAFAYLVTGRAAPVARDTLVEVIWGDAPPPEVETALNALLSKVRSTLKRVLSPASTIEASGGTIALRLPPNTWIDVEAAANALDLSEGALRRQRDADAWAHANVAVSIARRPFLIDEEGVWIEATRAQLRTLLTRALHVMTTVSARTGESELALQYANEIVRLEPFRETGYQHLMRLYAAGGNRGEALRVFGQLRELLRDELGTSPSPQTEALYMEILSA
jgi:SARP family transcriptional regulator, regulator of embCAB operon